MSYELISRKRPEYRPTHLLMTWGFVGLCLLLVLMVAGRTVQARLQLMAASRTEAAVWTGAAPPCPAMSRAAFVTDFHSYAPLGINLWETQIERRAGEITCSLVSPSLLDSHDYMSCRLTHPIFVRVAQGGRETFFRVGEGPARVRLEQNGRVSCRMGV